jgi:hypothetical protein
MALYWALCCRWPKERQHVLTCELLARTDGPAVHARGRRQCACPSPQCSCSSRADVQQQAAGRLRPLRSGANPAATSSERLAATSTHLAPSHKLQGPTPAPWPGQHARCNGSSGGPPPSPQPPLILQCYLTAGATSRGCHQPIHYQLNYIAPLAALMMRVRAPTKAAAACCCARRTGARRWCGASQARGRPAAMGAGHLSLPPPPTPQPRRLGRADAAGCAGARAKPRPAHARPLRQPARPLRQPAS